MSCKRSRNIICLGVTVIVAVSFTWSVYSCGQVVGYDRQPELTDGVVTSVSSSTVQPSSTAVQTVVTAASTAESTVSTGAVSDETTQPSDSFSENEEQEAPQEEEATQEEQSETAESGSWELLLVNSSHPLPDGYSFELTTLSNGMSVDSRIYPALEEMFTDMRTQGYAPYVREGYRTHEDQEAIMNTRISTYVSQGYSYENAEAQARAYVAVPGTSEHELGLAVDINSEYGYDEYAMYGWLAQNAYMYGFILRYPDGKTGVTGITYEPWHFRYVGTDAAAEIYSSGLTLEEYLGQ